jgi:hypothetical protein
MGQLDACDPATRAAMEEKLAAQQAEAKRRADAWAAGAPEREKTELVWNLCDHTATKQKAEQDMAHEKQNPSGYVDKGLLHDLGRTIQDEAATIAELKKQFLEKRGRAFTAKDCDGVDLSNPPNGGACGCNGDWMCLLKCSEAH